MTAPVLAFLDVNKPFIIYLDVSYYSTVVFLAHEHENGGKIQEGPIGYVTYQISSTHLKHPVMEKRNICS